MFKLKASPFLAAFLCVPLAAAITASAGASSFTMAQVLDYPYTSGLCAAEHADRIAWLRNVAGSRNVFVAAGPDFTPRQVTRNTQDDGQEITQLTFSPDGSHLLYVVGGDHNANWPAEGGLAPNAGSSAEQPIVTIWSASLSGGDPVKVAEGDAPALSARGTLAYIKNDQVWTTSLDGKGKPERLFFDRGKDSDLTWSPDGTRLAFVSARDDHAFIGIFMATNKPILYLAPSTGHDSSPRWSPDGSKTAFVRQPGQGGAPEPYLKQIPHPWSLVVADAQSGVGHAVWTSPNTLAGSFPDPDVVGGAHLYWGDGDRLVFLAYLDDWPHLYSAPLNGGAPLLLTPGAFMVEHVTESRDRRFMVYDANTGTTDGDDDRRHLFRVSVDRADPVALTSGETLDWNPVAASEDHIAFVTAGARAPTEIGTVDLHGGHRATLNAGSLPPDFPMAGLVIPKSVAFRAADATLVHGQLFEREDSAAPKPGIIFVHGGPVRQMMLGWHYMGFYCNAYAVNQYLANHGFMVLSVNYRGGIGYGRQFQQPDRAGPAGAAEYQDVVAGAHFLQSTKAVDRRRIAIWGGSYGGYLTALALARNSDIFKAGVDWCGVHDWSRLPDYIEKPAVRYEQGDRDAAIRLAWESSPDAATKGWKSPVLLIQGDDDRVVPFQQTIDLARRLDARHVSYEELVLPNEIHAFLRHASWLAADEATVEFLARKLKSNGQ